MSRNHGYYFAMGLLIELNRDVEQRLRSEAERCGVSIADYAARVLSDAVEPRPGRKLEEILDRWDAEDRTDDPTELARRRKEWEQFSREFDDNRSSSRRLFT